MRQKNRDNRITKFGIPGKEYDSGTRSYFSLIILELKLTNVTNAVIFEIIIYYFESINTLSIKSCYS